MREKHRENRQMRKTEHGSTDRAFHSFEPLRGIHTTDFLGCECDVSVSLITVVSDDLIGFIYMITQPPLLDVNDASPSVSSYPVLSVELLRCTDPF